MASALELFVYGVIGLFGIDAIPYFVRGITGQRHMTPFGSNSSAVLNVLWGSTNAAVAVVLAWWFRDAIEPATLAIAFATGVALAVWLAWFWSKPKPRLPWE